MIIDAVIVENKLTEPYAHIKSVEKFAYVECNFLTVFSLLVIIQLNY